MCYHLLAVPNSITFDTVAVPSHRARYPKVKFRLLGNSLSETVFISLLVFSFFVPDKMSSRIVVEAVNSTVKKDKVVSVSILPNKLRIKSPNMS